MPLVAVPLTAYGMTTAPAEAGDSDTTKRMLTAASPESPSVTAVGSATE